MVPRYIRDKCQYTAPRYLGGRKPEKNVGNSAEAKDTGEEKVRLGLVFGVVLVHFDQGPFRSVSFGFGTFHFVPFHIVFGYVRFVSFRFVSGLFVSSAVRRGYYR